jgi:hypothetical protein
VTRASECGEAADDECQVVEAGGRVLLQKASGPARAGAAVAAGVLLRDERDEVERLVQRERAELSRGRFCDEQVLALYSSAEDRPWMALRRQFVLSGAGGVADGSAR